MARIKAAILAFTSSFNQQLYTLRLARIKVILPPAILVTTQTSIKSYVWSTILHTQIGHVHWPESRRSYHQQFWHSQRFPRQSNLMIFVLPLLEAIINHISSLYSVHTTIILFTQLLFIFHHFILFIKLFTQLLFTFHYFVLSQILFIFHHFCSVHTTIIPISSFYYSVHTTIIPISSFY